MYRLMMRLGAGMALGIALQGPASASPEPSMVPIDVIQPSSPAPVRSESGSHLLYELRLTSFASRDLLLDGIEAIDAGSGKVIARISADAIASMVGPPGLRSASETPCLLRAGGFVIVYLDIVLEPGMPVPSALRHRISVASPVPGSPTRVFTTPALAVSTNTPVVLGAPVRGSGWLAANALSNSSDHRRAIAVVDGMARIAQRYAIDFVKLDAQGRAFRGDAQQNGNWAGFGTEILAVADGIVETASDGLPDNQPGSPPGYRVTPSTIGGNHVVLLLPSGHRVFYGHLRAGSLRVKPGDTVRRGQVIGELGNSGQSDAPHLHIHVSDAPSPLAADGQPYVFERFGLQGHVPSLTVLETNRGWSRPRGEEVALRLSELPGDLAVIDFGS